MSVSTNAKTHERTPAQAWLVLLVVFIASVATAANQFKAPPVMQRLMLELNVDMMTGGWLMSVFSTANVILSIPAAFLLFRLGIRFTGLLALGSVLLGSVIGALAPDAQILLLGRAIEGIGAALIGVTAPASISAWFEPRRRGLPMGVWAAWVPVGNVIMFNLAHPLQVALGWRSIWWFGAAFAAAAMLGFGLVVTSPAADERPATHPVGLGRALLNGSHWLLPLAFCTFSFSLIGYNTWAPTFLTEMLSIDPQTASFYASSMFLAGIVGNVIAGLVINRTRNRHRLLTFLFLITALIFLFSFRLGHEQAVMPYMGVLGLVSNFIPALVFTLAPETMECPEFAGLAMALIAVWAGVGALVGPPILGAVIDRAGWAAGGVCITVVMLVGTGFSSLAWKRWARQ